MPADKILEYLDHDLKPAMQENLSYIKASGNFQKQIKNTSEVSDGVILVIADAISFYSSIPHKSGLDIVEKA